MKFTELPDEVYNAEPTPVPSTTITLYDWPAMLAILIERGFVVIECPVEALRYTPTGAAECPEVKTLLNHAKRRDYKVGIKRLTPTRWACVLRGTP